MDDYTFPECIEALTENLEEQARTMRAVADVLSAQRTALASMHGSEQQKNEQSLEAPAREIVELETRRLKLHARLARQLGLEPRALRFRTIEGMLRAPLRARFSRAAAAARAAADELRLESTVGARLLEWSAHCHGQLLTRLATSGQDSETVSYGRGGHKTANSGSVLIDTTL